MKTLLIVGLVLIVVSMLVLTFRYIFDWKLEHIDGLCDGLSIGGVLGLIIGVLGIIFTNGLDGWGIVMVLVNLVIFGLLLHYCHWDDFYSWPVSISVCLLVGLCGCEMFLKYTGSSLWSQQLLVGTMFLSGQCFLVPFLFKVCGREVDSTISSCKWMGLLMIFISLLI
ncbi:MAG: hypothetical protein IJ830_07220 [Alphaproteobacteria bacterium]|nr:hypothetical protein [Alphaproteobacteria bacterium]